MPKADTRSDRTRFTPPACVLCLVIALGVSQAVSAQTEDSSGSAETTSRKVTPTSLEALAPAVQLPQLPLAFTKLVPESLDDLREMQAHVRSLVPKLTETTVALTVGNAQGSGVIVSEDGYVLTAAHVSGRPGRHVSITLSDGTRVSGRTLGRNQTLDASIIKIDRPERKWPYVAMARFEEIGVGDWSVVMGHPGGYQPDRPPVFRLGRVIHVDDQVIQTDNELVGGDSGGPLFDMYGRVIGINSRIGPSTTFNLHTPINVYADSWDRLIAGEDFYLHSGALLGVQGEPTESGLKITQVWPDEPAGRAGVKTGDILLRFGSRSVQNIEQLVELVGQHQPGDRITITILRDQETLEFTLALGQRKRADD